MKKLTKTSKPSRNNLNLAKETLRSLTSEHLGIVQGGLMHTSFSCGNDLCTTH